MDDDVNGRRRFEGLVAEVADPVRRYLWRRTDAATADEVLAETLAALWRREGDVPAERVAWAIGVARLQLANAQRSDRRRDRLFARIIAVDPPPATWTPADEEDATADAVRDVLAALRPKDAQLLRLWAWDELDPPRIAAVLGISVNAATVRLHRARKRFVDLWGENQSAAGHAGVTEGKAR